MRDTDANACEECHECCVKLPIQALNKKEGEPCKYLEKGKCGIYKNAPSVCRRFCCEWLNKNPLLDEEWRPDKCGFIIWKGKSFGRDAVVLKATKENLSKNGVYREAVLRLAKAYGPSFSVIK